MARLLTEMPGLAGEGELITLTHAGMGDEGFGTAPGGALLQATLRAPGDEALSSLRTRSEDLISRVASDNDLISSIHWPESFAATGNHAGAVEIVRQATAQCGLDLHEPEQPFRWSGGFGCFTQNAQGALLCLGAGENHPPLHAGNYEFPDELLEIGLGLWQATLEQAQASRS